MAGEEAQVDIALLLEVARAAKKARKSLELVWNQNRKVLTQLTLKKQDRKGVAAASDLVPLVNQAINEFWKLSARAKDLSSSV